MNQLKYGLVQARLLGARNVLDWEERHQQVPRFVVEMCGRSTKRTSYQQTNQIARFPIMETIVRTMLMQNFNQQI